MAENLPPLHGPVTVLDGGSTATPSSKTPFTLTSGATGVRLFRFYDRGKRTGSIEGYSGTLLLFVTTFFHTTLRDGRDIIPLQKTAMPILSEWTSSHRCDPVVL